MPSGAKRWYFRFYWRNKRQRPGLGQWPAVGLAEARARKAREGLDEGIDPRKAGIVKRASARTESPVRHALGPASHTVSALPAIGTAAHATAKIVRRPTDLSDDPYNVLTSPRMHIRYSLLAHEFYHRHVAKERKRRRPPVKLEQRLRYTCGRFIGTQPAWQLLSMSGTWSRVGWCFRRR
jgi:Arm DNA-binding domain